MTRKKTDTGSARISVENSANGGQRGAGALAFEVGDGKVASLLGIAASDRYDNVLLPSELPLTAS